MRRSELQISGRQARRQRGQCPPDFFLALHGIFLGRRKLVFLGGKNVKICNFGQKKPWDFGEDLFFWRSPSFCRKICDFGQKKPSDFGNFFFGGHLLLVGKFVISARKSLHISAKIFAPPISRSWRRPCGPGKSDYVANGSPPLSRSGGKRSPRKLATRFSVI